MAVPLGEKDTPFLLKYDADGNRLWSSTYRNHTTSSAGSMYHHLAIGKPGQIVVSGQNTYPYGQNHGYEFLVVSYDELTPRLSLAGVLAPGVRQGWLVSPRHSVFDILANADLGAGNWQTVSTVTNQNGFEPFFDPTADQHPFRFYRAKETSP